jgi:two-component system response regulator DevR
MPGYGSNLVKVFLLDDHDIVRRGLRDLLTAAPDLQVVGDASSTRGAARSILELGAQVMLLDLQLQDGTGIEVCRAVRAVDPSVRGLLLTSVNDDEALAASVLAGASGYIVKANQGADIIGAVRRVGVGRSLVDPALAEPVVGRLRTRLSELSLSEHEQQVLGFVLDGRTDSEIAERTGTDLDAVGPEVAELVGRLAAWAEPPPPVGQELPGRHRRG